MAAKAASARVARPSLRVSAIARPALPAAGGPACLRLRNLACRRPRGSVRQRPRGPICRRPQGPVRRRLGARYARGHEPDSPAAVRPGVSAIGGPIYRWSRDLTYRRLAARFAGGHEVRFVGGWTARLDTLKWSVEVQNGTFWHVTNKSGQIRAIWTSATTLESTQRSLTWVFFGPSTRRPPQNCPYRSYLP